MASHGLGRAYRDAALAKEVSYGMGFEHVANRRRGAVGVDVANFRGLEFRVVQSILHHAKSAFMFRSRLRDVVGVSAHAVTYQLGENRRAPALGELKVFQNQDARAFPNDKAV